MSGHHHHHSVDDDSEQKTRVVVVITLVTMIVEIYAGIVTKSMGLLADGWHMIVTSMISASRLIRI